MTSYVRLAPSEITPTALRRRRMQLGLVRRTAFLFGARASVRNLTISAIRRFERDGGGFALPTAYATSCFGKALQINCQPARLEQQLADWVSVDRRCLHLSDVFLGAGNWAPLISQSAVSPVAQEAAELQAHALDYRSTYAYKTLLEAAQRGQPVRRQQLLLATPAQIDRYFERFVALFRAISEQGIVPYRCLRERGVAEPGERDVGVAIAANGELLRLPGGQHRTAIARVLCLPAMPVEVRLLHIDWLRGVMARKNCSPFDAVQIGIAEVSG